MDMGLEEEVVAALVRWRGVGESVAGPAWWVGEEAECTSCAWGEGFTGDDA